MQLIFIFNTRAHPKKDPVTEEDARRRMVFVQNLLYLHGKRRRCDASSNWKLDARRVNENLSIHAPRTINYHFIWRGTSGIGYIPKRRSHHRRVIRACVRPLLSIENDSVGKWKGGGERKRTAWKRNRCDFKRMR